MEHEPFEDAFPVENGNIPASYVTFREGKWIGADAVTRHGRNKLPC